MSDSIDIRRPDDVVLRCPVCGLTRNMPVNWVEIMRRHPVTGDDWDGKLRCTRDQTVMTEETT